MLKMKRKKFLPYHDLLDTSEIYMSQSVLFTFLHDKWLKYQGSILCIEMHHTEYRWTLSTGNQSAFMPLLFGRLIHTNPISIINQCKQIYPIKTWNNLSFFRYSVTIINTNVT